MQELQTPFSLLNNFLQNFNLLGLFVIILLEEAGIPLPIPGDIFIFIAGVQARAGKTNLWGVIGVVTVATVIGASILYFASHKLARPVVKKTAGFFKIDNSKLAEVSHWFVKRGGVAVVVGRLTPGLRTLTSITAGILGFSYLIFGPFTGLAAVIWAVFYFLLGYFLGPGAIIILQIIGRYFVIFLGIAILIIASIFVLKKEKLID